MTARLRLFGPARLAAGTGRDELPGETVGELLGAAVRAYGAPFAALLPTCRIWVNGEEAGACTPVGPDDEVAVLPPVSGGAGPGPSAAGPPAAGPSAAGPPAGDTGAPAAGPPAGDTGAPAAGLSDAGTGAEVRDS